MDMYTIYLIITIISTNTIYSIITIIIFIFLNIKFLIIFNKSIAIRKSNI